MCPANRSLNEAGETMLTMGATAVIIRRCSIFCHFILPLFLTIKYQ